MINATNLTTVNLGNSDTVEVGDNVTAIGSPGGYMNTLSKGIISGINRENDRGYDIQTTASITHGSSGGPLFNRYGNVIGINYSGFESAGDIGFVIPINEINSLLSTTNEKTVIQINGQ
ncbi:S1C family serine protease [Clostridium estertheticum]|uniref:S1C family serine protease n=1 Tax=Clostridium estertheticum TaxID=238834 RepID=UPI002DD44D72|nr:trypsin-like peptidase domain-containing protein [Clostridium estertheticum]